MPQLSFFLASFAWNFGLGTSWLAIPLYAYSQGLSNAEIGALFALPVFAQVPFNLAGGAYTDRIGGRRIMLGSCWATAAAGGCFIAAEGFWPLMAGQVALVLSRAAFWPATWAMATELSGAGRGVQLGRLNAITNLGQIVGTGSCGFVLAAAGFDWTFAVLSAAGMLAFAAGLGTATPPAKVEPVRRHLLAAYLALLKERVIAYAVACAYLSALPFSLSISFYPLLLARYGYGEEASGVLVALRAVGSIAASLVASRFVRSGPQTLWPVYCGLVVACAVAFVPTINHPVPIAFWMLLVGAGSAAMTLYFQITISEASRLEQRGSALALGGLGWSVSHFSTPLIMGFVADRHGLVAGFYVVGAMALACALVIAWMRPWAFSGHRQPA